MADGKSPPSEDYRTSKNHSGDSDDGNRPTNYEGAITMVPWNLLVKSYRPHTCPSPQMVAEEGKSKLFQEHLGWWNITNLARNIANNLRFAGSSSEAGNI